MSHGIPLPPRGGGILRATWASLLTSMVSHKSGGVERAVESHVTKAKQDLRARHNVYAPRSRAGIFPSLVGSASTHMRGLAQLTLVYTTRSTYVRPSDRVPTYVATTGNTTPLDRFSKLGNSVNIKHDSNTKPPVFGLGSTRYFQKTPCSGPTVVVFSVRSNRA